MYALAAEKTLPKEVEDRLFMKTKDFALLVGASYNMVTDWIHQGMPVVPDKRSPYWVIVPAAREWLQKKFGF